MPINEWLSLTRRIDLSRAVAAGRRVQPKRYGGLNPDNVLLSGHKLADLRRAGRRPRGRQRAGPETASSRCHFFTDDDGVVHPIAKTCGHVRRQTAAEIAERYGADEPF